MGADGGSRSNPILTLGVFAVAMVLVWEVTGGSGDAPDESYRSSSSDPARVPEGRPESTAGPAESHGDLKWSAARLDQLAQNGASLSEQRDALRAGLRERGIDEAQIEAVMRHTAEALILRRQEQPSGSWIGGTGLLPEGTTEWPEGSSGAPFTPVAHFNLDELPKLPAPFPRSGTLEIFYDFEWFNSSDPSAFIDAGRTFHLEGDTAELEPPEGDIYREDAMYLTGALMPVAGEPGRVVEEVGGPENAKDVIAAMNELTKGLYGHQLGGPAREFQGDVLSEIPYDLEQASPEFRDRYSEDEQTDPGAWQLLAAIEPEGAVMFGDGGNLYVVIPKADLREGRFDRTLGIAQGA